TNVINPSVSVITKIGLDHKEFLGETLREIALQKAGIIKKGIPVVSALQEDEAMTVIEKRSSEMGCPLYIYERDFKGDLKDLTPAGLIFDYRDNGFELKDLFIPLTGTHQLENACLAIKAASLFTGQLDSEKVKYALKNIYWSGRLELFKADGMHFLFDGAHNPQAAERLSEALRDIYRKFYKRIILILGIMADKDIDGIVRAFDGLCDIIISTRPDYNRALEAEKLKKKIEALHNYNSSIYNAETVRKAIEMAGNLYRQGDLVVITGSFYTVGEAKVILGERESLRTLRESMEKKNP
ncbi:MAG: bifunctional folylpolyglutamate synthase/dihydrofolate synthase, partial [Thermodesulfovibrionales bacterium]